MITANAMPARLPEFATGVLVTVSGGYLLWVLTHLSHVRKWILQWATNAQNVESVPGIRNDLAELKSLVVSGQETRNRQHEEMRSRLGSQDLKLETLSAQTESLSHQIAGVIKRQDRTDERLNGASETQRLSRETVHWHGTLWIWAIDFLRRLAERFGIELSAPPVRQPVPTVSDLIDLAQAKAWERENEER